MRPASTHEEIALERLHTDAQAIYPKCVHCVQALSIKCARIRLQCDFGIGSYSKAALYLFQQAAQQRDWKKRRRAPTEINRLKRFRKYGAADSFLTICLQPCTSSRWHDALQLVSPGDGRYASECG